MASNARIKCQCCVFRHASRRTTSLSDGPRSRSRKAECMSKQVIAGRDEAVAGGAAVPSARWALASLSLSMLLSALGTSIANVALPTLAQAFNASFQEVQWIVLAYLLAITALIVSVGRFGDI